MSRTHRKISRFRIKGSTIAAPFVLAGCFLIPGGPGACVSDPVSFSFGDRVYCYDGWDEGDCSVNNAEGVNGASWFFHEGQSCADRGLSNGSNAWP